ncbi:MAG TPA: trypco2 family protein [Hyphomicrobiaceae bacterium]|nr:trypco2 family protein [Hyphomicrobiaceae bacterium]
MLAGCSTLKAPEPGGVVQVADIINSVKCGLAEALQSEAGRRRLPGTIATVELQLKIVDTRSFGASSPSRGPFVFAWQGPLVLPALSGSSEQSWAVDTTINLTYRLDAPNVTVCRADGVDRRDRFGFARWLADIIAGLSRVSLEGPRGSLDRLTYDATFAVTREGGVGGSLKVVFLDAGLEASRGRADTQRLRIVISGPNAIATSLDGVARSRSAPAIPNLSTARPSPP